MWGTVWPCTLLCCGAIRLQASVSQGERGIKRSPGTDWFRPGRGCGQETLSIAPCPVAIRMRDITNVNVTANAHGSTRNAHQEPKPMPVLDRRTKRLNSGSRPWLRFSLMHMEARECVVGLRGPASLIGSTPGVQHHPASHMVPVIVLDPLCPGPHQNHVNTPKWPAPHIQSC